MLTQFFTIGSLMLLSAMLPGPDFALVTKNTLLHSRRAGIFTSLGIGAAILVHISYCVCGLAIIISQSLLLFSVIKYIGAAYLAYLGLKLLWPSPATALTSNEITPKKSSMSSLVAFRQGFLCNIFNPKATLFFLALFTMIIKPNTSVLWEIIYAVEMFVIIVTWFCVLSLLLSHPLIAHNLQKIQKYIEKALGVFLLGFSFALILMKKQ